MKEKNKPCKKSQFCQIEWLGNVFLKNVTIEERSKGREETHVDT